MINRATKREPDGHGRFALGAGVGVVDRRHRLLLVRRRVDAAWAMPGGHIELGESFEACARREFREETGHDVSLVGLLGVYSNPSYAIERSGEGYVHYLGVFFDGRIGERIGDPDEEIMAIGWFAGDTLPSPIWPPDQPIISDALSTGGRPFIR